VRFVGNIAAGHSAFPARSASTERRLTYDAVELYHFCSSLGPVPMALEENGVPWISRYIDRYNFE
jgi:hypothetical protein